MKRLPHSLLCALLTLPAAAWAADSLESAFQNPPPSARPWVYWFPLDGNISSNGITLDLEAMKRVGIGGVLYMETDQGAPTGPAAFAGPLWRNLFKHICSEAHRLGLEVNVNNDAGWCGSGGPWITPELSMQRVVWSETNVAGPRHLEAQLPQPQANLGYYADIAVFAYPTPANRYPIPNLAGKTAATTQEIPLRAAYAKLPDDTAVPRDKVIMLDASSWRNGRLTWDVPAGNWTVLRLGHTTTGKDNHPAPASGRGLECDKLSSEAADAAFAGLMSKIIGDSKVFTGTDKTLVSTHIDSWEVGSQNWTPKFREDFKRLRGYDPAPYLPVMAGQVVDSLEVSERFLWDVRMTVSDLLVQNYAGRFQELARRNGIRLSIEAYGEPADDLTYAGRADEPMSEFWSWGKFGAAETCPSMASAAHVYGKRILGAEAFTATDAEKWQGYPGNIKDLGDWAFCQGINRFVFHRYALQPWDDVRPGMSMGPWGLHYERTQTWWEQSRAWHEYLARCQYMLQQGLFVADLCFLSPESSPQTFKSPVKSGLDRPGYNFDGCPPEVLFTRMKVKSGRLVLPDGMSYRMLVLPNAETMTPKLLRRVKELVAEGATVVGAPPLKSPSLSGYPQCDNELQGLVEELWGRGEPPAELTAHAYGKGRIYWGGAFKPRSISPAEPATLLGAAKWIWFNEGNPAASAPAGKRFFRREIEIDSAKLASAQLAMTADNSFECQVNGHAAGSGDSWNRVYEMDLKPWLKPGKNLITVTAVNGTSAPNPAGLIGLLRLKYENGGTAQIATDRQWQASPDGQASTFSPALELGEVGIAPWGDIQSGGGSTDTIPDINLVAGLLQQMGVPPDFVSQTRTGSQNLRYIHRAMGDTDIYFVANKNGNAEQALCSFRVSGRRPELWWPDTGRTERAAVYDDANGITRVPINLEPFGSVFVVFRKAGAERDRVLSVTRNGTQVLGIEVRPASAAPATGAAIELSRNAKGAVEALIAEPGTYTVTTANRRNAEVKVAALPEPFRLDGPFEVRFAPGWGAPDRVTFDKLISWSEHTDPGVKYFSGVATYAKTFTLPAGFQAADQRVCLDLGKVAVMAEVRLNGQALGILWKAPYKLDVTSALKAGENSLEIKVVNLWINRQIGDELLPEDSDRKPDGTLKSWPDWLQQGKRSPTGRYTFTSWRLWKKNDPLVESGLLGPVTLSVAKTATLKF